MTAGPTGLLLAAGAGRRMGGPKSLLHDASGRPFLDRAVAVLLDGGCASVTVVLGASADEARLLVPSLPSVAVVVADDWAEGMGASLRTGLRALDRAAPAAVVSLVDLPDVGPEVVRRVLAQALRSGRGPRALVRTTYDGRPGHPVLIGREHWDGVAGTARGDHGARDWFRTHPPEPCECADLATGRDVDRPEDL